MCLPHNVDEFFLYNTHSMLQYSSAGSVCTVVTKYCEVSLKAFGHAIRSIIASIFSTFANLRNDT